MEGIPFEFLLFLESVHLQGHFGLGHVFHGVVRVFHREHVVGGDCDDFTEWTRDRAEAERFLRGRLDDFVVFEVLGGQRDCCGVFGS